MCTKVTANSHLQQSTYPTLLSALLRNANTSRFICFPNYPVGLARGRQTTVFWDQGARNGANVRKMGWFPCG